jgi:hypothetical protein
LTVDIKSYPELSGDFDGLVRNKSEPEVIHRRSTSDPPPRPAPPDHRKTVAIGTRPSKSPESSG